jgi:phage terminase Nu1 subunit (DNA packaging protein)
MYEYSLNRLAGMLGVDRQTMVRALAGTSPDAGTDKKPLFRVATASDALARHRVKPDGRLGTDGNSATAQLTAERARLAREQAEAVSLKNAVTRGELVRLATVQRSAEMIFAAFRERCLTVPGKIAAICEMRSRGEVEETVRAEIYECLEVLSGPILPVDGASWEGGSDAAVGHDEEEGIIQ